MRKREIKKEREKRDRERERDQNNIIKDKNKKCGKSETGQKSVI